MQSEVRVSDALLGSKQSNRGLEATGVQFDRMGSNQLRAASLIPAWMVSKGPMMWRCDERTLAGVGNVPFGEVRALVALWCGFDPDSFDTTVAFTQAIESWRRNPDGCADLNIAVFLQALEIATSAVMCGDLLILEELRDPVDATQVSVQTFKAWAERTKLVRPHDPRHVQAQWGSYMTPRLLLLSLVLERHYRLKVDGGPYDPEDPATHPTPQAIRKTMREFGVISATEKDLVAKMARDPRIPVGRRSATKT
jgi:hypothetical protein